MKTFDFETAWKEQAQPQFNTLPDNLRSLYSRVIDECGDIAQGKNLDMPWPVHGEKSVGYFQHLTLRELFDKIPAELLAVASRVIHDYGHWYPGGNTDRVGGSWKFSNYADQSLALRINETLSPHWPTGGNGISFRIHEGFIRAQCSTPDSWTWQEICLATLENWEKLKAVPRGAMLQPSPTGTRRARSDWETFSELFPAYCEALKAATRSADPVHGLLDTDRYMVDESEIAARKAAALAATPGRLDALKAELLADYNRAVEKLTIEYRGKLWLLEHGIDTGNAIYYSHTGRWCFGWYKPLTEALKSSLLDVLTEFPYDYDLKEVARAGV
jgi:hypothetical protein